MFEKAVVLVMKLVAKYYVQYVTVILNYLSEVMQYERLHYSCRMTFSSGRKHHSVSTETTLVRYVLSS